MYVQLYREYIFYIDMHTHMYMNVHIYTHRKNEGEKDRMFFQYSATAVPEKINLKRKKTLFWLRVL